LQQEQTRVQTAIHEHIDRHPRLKQDPDLLCSIPAVGEKTAQRWLAVLHGHDFTSADQVPAFLGLVPIECQSGSSLHRRPRLSKAGAPRIRAALYMAAVVATRHNPHIQALYQRLLARGKAKMAALGAAMRKLVQLAFGVLKHQQPYQRIRPSPLDRQDGIYTLRATRPRANGKVERSLTLFSARDSC
jgi:transposase